MSDQTLCFCAIVVVLIFNLYLLHFARDTGLFGFKGLKEKSRHCVKMYRSCAAWHERIFVAVTCAFVLSRSGLAAVLTLASATSLLVIGAACKYEPLKDIIEFVKWVAEWFAPQPPAAPQQLPGQGAVHPN
ncbi:hypothetical protein N183_14965 [Sinorhizobium sp. Sb3]|nr:hypothetical protein N183_14965 [Sinorhizobium sp. Sb3]